VEHGFSLNAFEGDTSKILESFEVSGGIFFQHPTVKMQGRCVFSILGG